MPKLAGVPCNNSFNSLHKISFLFNSADTCITLMANMHIYDWNVYINPRGQHFFLSKICRHIYNH